MMTTSIILFVVGLAIVIYMYKFQNHSENYDALLPFAIGVVLMALGAVMGALTALVRYLP